jgi:hypothetical protein
MGKEELRTYRVERRVQDLFDSRQVNLRIFRSGMVSMNYQCPDSDQQKEKNISTS